MWWPCGARVALLAHLRAACSLVGDHGYGGRVWRCHCTLVALHAADLILIQAERLPWPGPTADSWSPPAADLRAVQAPGGQRGGVPGHRVAADAGGGCQCPGPLQADAAGGASLVASAWWPVLLMPVCRGMVGPADRRRAAQRLNQSACQKA